MIRTIAPELEKLDKRLGTPPMRAVVSAFHHAHYLVAAGSGTAFAGEVQQRTGYRLASVHGNGSGRVFRMDLENDPVGLLVREDDGNDAPRMDLLALTVPDLEPVKRALADAGIGCHLHPAGLISERLPELEMRLLYVSAHHYDWLGAELSDTFPPLPAALPAGRIGRIDHIALRVRQHELPRAVELLVRLAGYAYSECYTIAAEGAETVVLRARPQMPAIVLSYGATKEAVVRQYVERYGPRVHHTAFYTENIAAVEMVQRARRVPFTSDALVGSPQRGILQVFTAPSEYSLEITEYVERFHGFRGFFDPGNVGELMASTRQFSA